MNQESSFGAFIRQRRREMDLTQEELARRVGCAAITLRKIEADDLRASVQVAERLAMALAIPLEQRADFVRRARAVRPELAELPKVTPAPSLEEIGREDLTGRAIRGYALAERIGMGGMGSVYRAVQPNVEREVAVKIILPAFANHPDFIRRFEAEAQLVARLEHPHIVPLYDYWREPGVAYLVMRLLRGGNVQNMMKQGAPSIETIAHMLEQICSALNAAHRIGIIHRDLKPANVLLDEDNNAYLADFGIAKNLGNPDLENQTQMDAIIGSPEYMSPEQIRSLSVRPETDIYCLGVMLYEMLTGALPFTGPTPFDLIQHHINTPMPSLAAHRTGLPAALDAVITRATAKEPGERYTDALAFFHDFRQAIGRMVDAHPLPVTYDEEEETIIESANPFKGLRAFNEADADNFFGRETLIQQLLARLGEGGELSRFLGVIGPSGSGKSSVVRAGLIPALRRGGLPGSENWFVVDMLPGKHPFEELEAALLRVAVNPPESLLSQLKDGNRGLLRAVHRILPADDSVQLILVVDQFEEIFTLVEDEAERALLLENLASAVLDERSRLRVIITLRADFTDKPLRYVDFGEMLNRRFEFVLPLTADEVERAVAGPVQRIGLKLEKGLVSTIIREAGNQPGTLPLLQYALSELFEKREGRTLTNKAYREIGGVLGALGRSAESIFSGLDAKGQTAARQLFLRLVTLGEGTEDTRRRVLRDEFEGLNASEGQLTAVIEAFGRARLLTFDRDPITRGATIEVAHEALLREWTRLREWLTESRADIRLQRQLAAMVGEWQSAGRDTSFLLTGARLEQFEGWSANTSVALTQDEKAYLDASIAERDRRESEERIRQQRELENARKLAETERQRAEEQTQSATQLRKRAYYLTGAFAIALVMAVAAIFFGRQAQHASRLATSRELAAGSISNLEIDPERSILLALQAVRTTYSADRTVLPEAEEALHRAILASRVELTLSGHTGEVWGVAYHPDGTQLATSSSDGTIKLWDSDSGRELLTLTGHAGPVFFIEYDPGGTRLASASADGTAKVWAVGTGETLLTLSGHADLIFDVAFSPDGKYLATSSVDKTAKVWDLESGELLLTLTGYKGFVNYLNFSPNGELLAAGGEDGTVKLWDVAQLLRENLDALADTSGRELVNLQNDGGAHNSPAFSPDGKLLATGTESGLVKVWDVEASIAAASGQELLTLRGHAGPVTITGFSPDGTRLVSGSFDGTARVWDVTSGLELFTLAGHTSAILNLAFSPDGTRLATSSWDGTAKVWNLSYEWELTGLVAHESGLNGATAVAFNPDGTRLVTSGDDGKVKIWELEMSVASPSSRELVTLVAHTAMIWDIAFSPDGTRLAIASDDGTIGMWNADSSRELFTLTSHAPSLIDVSFNGVTSLDFSPDGKWLASVGDDGMVRIWDTTTGLAVFATQAHTADYSAGSPFLGASGVAFSPDGTRLATTGTDDKAIVWDVSTALAADAQPGAMLLTLSGHQGDLSHITFNFDGTQLATASLDSTAKVWDAESGDLLLTLSGHTGGVMDVVFSPDGTRLATVSLDGTAKVWDATTGEALLTLYGHTGVVNAVAFSPDGTRLITANPDGTVRVYVLPIEDLVALGQSRVTRSLTVEECWQYLHVDVCPALP